MRHQYSDFCLLVGEIVDKVFGYIDNMGTCDEVPELWVNPSLIIVSVGPCDEPYEFHKTLVDRYIFKDREKGWLPDLDAIEKYAANFYDIRRAA